jgi:hypothetical protein
LVAVFPLGLKGSRDFLKERIEMKLAKLILATILLASGLAQAQVNRIPGPGTLDSQGSAQVNTEGQKASYFAGLGGNTPAATPTDVAILTGSASKTIKVTRVRVTVSTTAASLIEYRLVFRSGGTQSAVNTAFAAATHAGPFDSLDAASSVITAGLAGVYTSNPASTGTVVGIIDDWTLTSVTGGTVNLVYECSLPTKCITLRGVAQVLAVNGNGHTLATGEKFGVEFSWTEE